MIRPSYLRTEKSMWLLCCFLTSSCDVLWLEVYDHELFYKLRPRRNRRHFADDIFKCIFLNENEWISLGISLKFVPKVRINNIPSLVQIMACRRPGNKPLSEPMVVSLLTHICVTRPQWVKYRCGGEMIIRLAISIVLREKQVLFPYTLANNQGIWSK